MAGQPPRANLWSPSLRGTGAHFSMSSGYRTQTLILVQWALHRLSHLPRPVFPFTDTITILFMRIIACTWKYDCRINFLNADTVIKNVYLQSSLQAMSKCIPNNIPGVSFPFSNSDKCKYISPHTVEQLLILSPNKCHPCRGRDGQSSSV